MPILAASKIEYKAKHHLLKLKTSYPKFFFRECWNYLEIDFKEETCLQTDFKVISIKDTGGGCLHSGLLGWLLCPLLRAICCV